MIRNRGATGRVKHEVLIWLLAPVLDAAQEAAKASGLPVTEWIAQVVEVRVADQRQRARDAPR